MAAVGPGVREIRIHTGLEHRVIYIAKFDEGVYVLHAFEKKTRRTAKADIDAARSRLRDVMAVRVRSRRGIPRRSR
jgi:phage-related protein